MFLVFTNAVVYFVVTALCRFQLHQMHLISGCLCEQGSTYMLCVQLFVSFEDASTIYPYVLNHCSRTISAS